LIGLARDGLASFEPAFVAELAAIMQWSFDYVQRDAGQQREKSFDAVAKGGTTTLTGGYGYLIEN